MEISIIEARDLSEAWFLCLCKTLTEGYEYKIERGSYAGQRRKELDLAVTAWVKHGGRVELLTLTFPHEADMPLAELMPKFAKALQSFKNSKRYKAITKTAGRAGNIRSLETTWGANGWHPHVHELVFLDGEILGKPSSKE